MNHRHIGFGIILAGSLLFGVAIRHSDFWLLGAIGSSLLVYGALLYGSCGLTAVTYRMVYSSERRGGWYHCTSCEYSLIEDRAVYCAGCGRKINWSDKAK